MIAINRKQAIVNLKKYIGRDLSELAKINGITTFKSGKQNKGWKGLVLERLAGLQTNISKAPNGISYEVKSVSFYYVKGELVPKETMAITMINPDELKNQNFFESHCWNKLKSMIFCAVMWHGKNSINAELLRVASLDFTKSDFIIKEIEADYEFIRNKLITQGFQSLTGRDGKWIQARTKGSGHGSISRAFYARKSLVSKIFELSS
jgi:DNA mismatch repair protein MutH